MTQKIMRCAISEDALYDGPTNEALKFGQKFQISDWEVA